MDDCLQKVARNPEMFAFAHRDIRMALVRRFPYLVLYRIADDTIAVIAIFHAKRDPGTWQER